MNSMQRASGSMMNRETLYDLSEKRFYVQSLSFKFAELKMFKQRKESQALIDKIIECESKLRNRRQTAPKKLIKELDEFIALWSDLIA